MRALFVLFTSESQAASTTASFPLPQHPEWRPYALDLEEFQRIFGRQGFSFEQPISILPDRARKSAFDALCGALESRMNMGETIFLYGGLSPLEHSPAQLKPKDIKAVIALARAYDYKIFPVHTGLETLPPAPNNSTGKTFPDSGSWIRKPDRKIIQDWIALGEINSRLCLAPQDLSSYERIILVGDIQGAGDELQELITRVPGGLDDPKNFWIFVGDLFDRGASPVTVYHTMVPKRENVVILQGNHEIAVRRASTGTFNYDKPDDTLVTIEALNKAGITKRAVREDLINRSVPFYSFMVNSQEHWVSHGGVIPAVIDAVTLESGERLVGLLADEVFSRGTNHMSKALYGKTNYDNFADELDAACARRGIVQWFGHRHEKRMEGMSPLDFEAIRPLESGVEHRGGFLTAVMLTNNGAAETLIRVPSTSTVKPFR